VMQNAPPLGDKYAGAFLAALIVGNPMILTAPFSDEMKWLLTFLFSMAIGALGYLVGKKGTLPRGK